MWPFLRNLLLYSNIVVASGLFVSYRYTCLLFHLNLNQELVFFLFFAVSTMYHLHGLLLPPKHLYNEREAFTKRYFLLFVFLAFFSALGSLYFLYQLSLREAVWLSPVFISSVVYLAPKIPSSRINFFRRNIRMKTTMLAITWIYTMDVLPFLVNESTISSTVIFYWLYRYMLIYVVCVLFDYRDRKHDAQHGIPSFIYQLQPKQLLNFLHALLLFAMVSNVLLFNHVNSLQLVMHSLPVMLLYFGLPISMKTNSDTWYLLVLDNFIFLAPWIGCISTMLT